MTREQGCFFKKTSTRPNPLWISNRSPAFMRKQPFYPLTKLKSLGVGFGGADLIPDDPVCWSPEIIILLCRDWADLHNYARPATKAVSAPI